MRASDAKHGAPDARRAAVSGAAAALSNNLDLQPSTAFASYSLSPVRVHQLPYRLLIITLQLLEQCVML